MAAKTASHVSRRRWPRRLRTGWQGGTGQLHLPSGIGPAAQAPPREIWRVQTQRSPLRAGWHWHVARHSPPLPGP